MEPQPKILTALRNQPTNTSFPKYRTKKLGHIYFKPQNQLPQNLHCDTGVRRVGMNIGICNMQHLHLRGLRSASTWPRVVSISMLRSSRSSSHRSHQHHAAALRRRHPPDGPVLCVWKGPLESHGVQRQVARVRKRWWPFWWVHDVQDCGAPPLLPRIRLALRILYLRVLCCCKGSVHT